MPSSSKRLFLAVAVLVTANVVGAHQSLAAPTEEAIVNSATAVLNEAMVAPANRIPQTMLQEAHGVAIFPQVVKGGFIVGARHGRGVAIIRDATGAWQQPIFVTLTGGSVGWQAGLQSSDIILVFKTRKSVDRFLNGKFTLGADVSVAAGPVGRQAAAATDTRLQAEILSYARSRGLFAGAAIDGSSIQADNLASARYYQTNSVTADGLPVPAVVPHSAILLQETVSRHVAGVAGGQPLAVVPPHQAAVVDSAPAASATEATRARLAAASIHLANSLDANWKEYLALPAETYQPGGQPRVEELRVALAHYDAIAGQQQYLNLNQRDDFRSTHQLLRGYLQSVNATAVLQLPPPPR